MYDSFLYYKASKQILLDVIELKIATDEDPHRCKTPPAPPKQTLTKNKM